MIQTLEAVIASALILIAIIYFSIPQGILPETKLVKTGFNCLKDLDNKGLLRYYASNNLESDLKRSLENCLPLDFDVRICGIDCSLGFQTNETAISVNYLIAGEKFPNPMQVKLWMWAR